MRMNTGQTFLCYLRNVEMRDHGPHLMLRFAQNLDKVKVGPDGRKPDPLPVGVVF